MINLIQISSLEKIMPKYEQQFVPISQICVLKGERASYQIAYCMDNTIEYNIEFESEIKEHLRIYKIGCVPVTRAVFNYEAISDDNYISTEGGMYPDILYPFNANTIRGQYYYQGIWIETDEKISGGKHEIKVTISNDKESVSSTLTIEVLSAEIPEQKLMYSLAVHGDCIANYYNMEVFSEEYWQMLEKFIKMSAEYGSNGLVLPLFTPPVDTKVGLYRRTIQLVDIYKENDKYSFDFTKAKRFLKMCQNSGIKYFFMPQFFTQWGAEYAPQIIVNENGESKRLFGWDIESTDERYLEFLHQFIPAITDWINEEDLKEKVVFSISDEPFDDETVKRYKKLNDFLRPYLKEYAIIDAFQNYKHYKDSGAPMPLIPTSSIRDFEEKVTNLNVYYCCAQDYKVSNRLIAMPSYRNRCFGYQLYKYNVQGFFHWALNFYNSQLSIRTLNPFYETDADGGFPAGDPYIVYPADEGPIPSLRLIVFNEALQDLRVLQLLEKYIGRNEVIKLIENITGEIAFDKCAQNANIILKMREKIMSVLKEYTD